MKNTSLLKKEVFAVAGYTPWSKEAFKKTISKYPGQWHIFTKKEQLTEKNLKKMKPKYIFFLHWSWWVPEKIIENYQCICFHMTNVPYGRGGSPLQNLIIRGHKKSKLTALKMTKKFDAGPVYMKKSLSLQGRAEEIYTKANNLAAEMILKIIRNKTIPKHQKGKVVVFKRRKPEQSEIPECKNLQKLYDFIRMLDAEGYPKAFIRYKGFIFEFSFPKKHQNKITSKVEIKKINKKK